MTQYRIGIDVGGTFTHAVALDNSSLELAGQVQVFTTHDSKNGVADGIINSLQQLLKNCSICPADIVFIAHSTTQATNALLEGDVCPVGVISTGSGLEGRKVKSDTNLSNIEIGCGLPAGQAGKMIRISHSYLEKSDLNYDNLSKIIDGFIKEGISAIVAAGAFSVDDPSQEKYITEFAIKKNIPAIGTHEISGLYGLKIRARTAIVNASILPKMIETADAIERCLKTLDIKIPLMIMRSDGGAMKIDEVKKRPILTILSGPAAGIASALMYVKISNGIFVEVGGTSTDISVIRNGKALVKSAEIGGNKLYLRTLDCRTVGIAGGSLPRLSENNIVDVGPRSAHILGLKYSSFSSPGEIKGLKINNIERKSENAHGYFSLGEKYGITVTCAANILGLAKPGDWAYGNIESAKEAFAILSEKLFGNALKINHPAEMILKIGCKKVINTINSLIKDYKLEKGNITLIGGGGGAAAIVPFTAKEMGLDYAIAKNHAVISAIGAALAFVCDTVERTIISPGEKDILKIRNDAEESVIRMGADPETIEITVEIDQQKNILRASASGSKEFNNKDILSKEITLGERRAVAARLMRVDESKLNLLGSTGRLDVWAGLRRKSIALWFIKTSEQVVAVSNHEGVIRFIKSNASAIEINSDNFAEKLSDILEKNTSYGDAGEKIPQIYIAYRSKIIDLSSLVNRGQVIALAEAEIKNMAEQEKVVIILGQ